MELVVTMEAIATGKKIDQKYLIPQKSSLIHHSLLLCCSIEMISATDRVPAVSTQGILAHLALNATTSAMRMPITAIPSLEQLVTIISGVTEMINAMELALVAFIAETLVPEALNVAIAVMKLPITAGTRVSFLASSSQL